MSPTEKRIYKEEARKKAAKQFAAEIKECLKYSPEYAEHFGINAQVLSDVE